MPSSVFPRPPYVKSRLRKQGEGWEGNGLHLPCLRTTPKDQAFPGGVRGKGPTYQIDCHTPSVSSNACDFPLNLAICSPFPNLQKLSALGDTAKSPALGKTDEIIADPCSKSPLVFPTHVLTSLVWRETETALELGVGRWRRAGMGCCRETKMAKEEELEASTQGPRWEGQRMQTQA